VAAPDANLGFIAAGYGMTVARWTLVCLMVAPVLLIGAVAVAVAVLVVTGGSADAISVMVPVIGVGYLAVVLTVRFQRRRFQRLHNSGLLAVQAAHIAATTPVPAPAAAGAGWAAPGWIGQQESQFTVPYQAAAAYSAQTPYGYGVPAGGYGQPVPPVPAGPVEIRVKAGPVLLSLGLLTLLAGYLWLRVLVYASLRQNPVLLVLVSVLAVLYTALVTRTLINGVRALANPVVARFSADGWQLPTVRMAGTWQEVREIRVRSIGARRSLLLTQMPNSRIVALIVDDPQRYLAQAPATRRRAARAALRQLGSPVTLLANPRRTVDVVHLVTILKGYTGAPVNWA
jgi:hypothetical protein